MMLFNICAVSAAAVVVSAAPAATKDYDYIIVGGGTTGLALATRMSQDLPKGSILVIEAGPSAPDELRINAPGMRGSTLGSVYDWNFTTIPQEHLDGKSIDVPRGKVLGGTSAINYLCYDRAASVEYDAWEQMGNKGWNWETMVTAMIKSENYTGPADDKRGSTGPIKNTFNRYIPEIFWTWKPSMNKIGIPTNQKYMAGDPIGVNYQGTNIDNVHWNRSYSASGYLPLASSSLEVRANTLVAKVEFAQQEAGKPLHALGVILANGTKIAAKKEVILSAGALQTPGLLERSGIGQAAVLKAAGLPQLLELQGVGENFQDHIRTSNSYILKSNFTSFDPLIYDNQGKYAGEQVQLWIEGKPSLYGSTSTAYAFLNWGQVAGNESVAELNKLAKDTAAKTGSVMDKKKTELMANPSVPQLEIVFENNYVGEKGYPAGKAFLTIITSVMHPMSRGTVHIDPKAPLGKPIVDAAYFSSLHDMKASVAGAKFARTIANTEPMRSLWTEEYEPGPEVKTEEQWNTFAKKSLLSFFHPVGTAAMLPEKDGGVVGPTLVVHGTSNLRVVDLSVMPLQLSGHPQTAAYGIAEIAAEIIVKAGM